MSYTPKKGFKQKREAGIRELSQMLNVVTKPAFRRRGFAENKILTDWKLIVGDRVAEYSIPRRISFARDKKSDGTLYVEVYDGGMAMELEYMKNIVLEKIAQYFGYKAVAEIRIKQKPGGKLFKTKVEEPYVEPQVPDGKKGGFDELMSGIEDEQLREALSSLGRKVLSSEKNAH